MTDSPALAFTGERFTPECPREIWYEHWHRYVFVRDLARGRRVLDAACGEGYGSALLAQTAGSVLGLDLDAAAIAHARQRYGHLPGLQLRQGSVTAIEADDASFDLIVSFETIEHLADQTRMLDEFRRVLAADGVLVLSSPDRHTYNAGAVEANPFHVRELDRAELLTLLEPRFPAVRLHGQALAFHSMLWSLDKTEGPAQSLRMDAGSGRISADREPAPVYYLALCAATEALLPELPALSLFTDEQASVYSHYNAEIARLIRADHRLIELERELTDLRAALAARS